MNWKRLARALEELRVGLSYHTDMKRLGSKCVFVVSEGGSLDVGKAEGTIEDGTLLVKNFNVDKDTDRIDLVISLLLAQMKSFCEKSDLCLEVDAKDTDLSGHQLSVFLSKADLTGSGNIWHWTPQRLAA